MLRVSYHGAMSLRRYAFLFSCVWLLADSSVEAGEYVVALDARPEPGQEIAHPIAYWTESWTEPRLVVFHVMRVDTRSPECEIFVLLANDPDGEGPAEAELTMPMQLMEEQKALAAVNASAFRHLGGVSEEEKKRGWFQGKQVDIVGLAASDGVVRSLAKKGQSCFWIDASGQAHVGYPDDPKNIQHGLGDWIQKLIIDGVVSVKDAAGIHPRTLAGVDSTGRYVFLVVADGRQLSYSVGISLIEAAQFMKELGCTGAVNLDGGGSSIMISADEEAKVLNRPSGFLHRPIPVMLGVRKKEQ